MDAERMGHGEAIIPLGKMIWKGSNGCHSSSAMAVQEVNVSFMLSNELLIMRLKINAQ